MNQDVDVEPGEVRDLVPVEESSFDLATASPVRAMEHAQEVVQFMSEKCKGSQYIAVIQGRKYPKVEWWTTVGMSLGLFPAEVVSERFDMEKNHYGYRSVVEVLHKGQVVTRASAICTTEESAWGKRDEYAVKSMATTRATGKAYRIGLSGLAVLAGLEPAPADEIPPQGFNDRNGDGGFGVCPEHNVPFFQTTNMKEPAHKPVGNARKWCNKSDVEDRIADAQQDPPVRAHTSRSEAREKAFAALDALYPDGDKDVRQAWLKDALPAVYAKGGAGLTDADWEAVAEAADATRTALHPEDEDAEGESK
jgi:hypothetical protein